MAQGAPEVLSRFFSRRSLLADRFLYALPGDLSPNTRDVFFWTRSGVQLRGWFVRGSKPGVVVFCPGNTANVTAHFEYVRMAVETGYSVLAFDYQGFGRSDGELDLRAISSSVEAACEFAASHTREPVALFGVSLGAQVALRVAASQSTPVAGVVAEGAADIEWMLRGLFAAGSFGHLKYRKIEGPSGGLKPRHQHQLSTLRLPRTLAIALASAASALYPFPAKSLRGLSRKLASTPIFLIHGVEDPLLPCEAALEFHDALLGPRRLWLIPGVAHAQEPVLLARREYVLELTRFLDEAFCGFLVPSPQVKIVEIQAPDPQHGYVRACLGLEEPARGAPPHGRVLLTVAGGGVLRQAILNGQDRVSMDFPGPIERLVTLRLLSQLEDSPPPAHLIPGCRSALRRISQLSSEREASGLEAALEDYLGLDRQPTADLFVAMFALRSAQAALGEAPHWEERGRPAASRRCLERFLELWTADPTRPGEDIAGSPAAWARARLNSLQEGNSTRLGGDCKKDLRSSS